MLDKKSLTTQTGDDLWASLTKSINNASSFVTSTTQSVAKPVDQLQNAFKKAPVPAAQASPAPVAGPPATVAQSLFRGVTANGGVNTTTIVAGIAVLAGILYLARKR